MSSNDERCGIVLIDKPHGLTSHDVVDLIRRKLKIRKVGHAGTLDPMATGLLIILLGRYTKKSDTFLNYDKEYVARMMLGVSTDTGDKEGRTIRESDISSYRERIDDMEEVFASFKGSIQQIPPMYSAKKLKGKKLYELARKGIVVERQPRTVQIKDIVMIEDALPHVTFRVRCSKGTYIRQLAHDIGEKVGCGAHLVSLKRTEIGPYGLDAAIPAGSDERVLHENILQA
ncbi:MAG: tRNA pseudouridine(55) synthase TruB [Candidatus Omnitrophota bacterium]